MPASKSFQLIDKPTFFSSLALLLLSTVPLLIWPEAGAIGVAAAQNWVQNNFGSAYILLAVGALIFMVYIAFSRVGSIHMGREHEGPEFNTVSWAAMLFCAGIGIGIMYWSMIEWVYYYTDPPFDVVPRSKEAAKLAASYGIFHWGPLAWAIYLIPALPMAYFYHARRVNQLKLSGVVAPVIGNRNARGFLGKLIDTLFVFGMLGGAATSLSLGAPLINQGLHELFGLPVSNLMKVLVLLLCTVIFGASAYAGIKKGIQNLSNLNLIIALLILLYVFVMGPTVFIAEAALESLGTLANNFMKMTFYLESMGGINGYSDTAFPQDWTVFYWAWWLAFAPSIGLFIARISRGRTMSNMILGSLIYGSMGCALFFMVFGNYGLHLQLSGELDVVQTMVSESPEAAIFAILGSLPLGTVVIFVYTLLGIIFLSTTFDSISYILASVVQTEVDDEPLRWNRLFWAGCLSFMPIVLFLSGGTALSTVKAASIVSSFPLLLVAVLLCVSVYRVGKYDLAHHSDDLKNTIERDKLPEHDPWSRRGTWDLDAD